LRRILSGGFFSLFATTWQKLLDVLVPELLGLGGTLFSSSLYDQSTLHLNLFPQSGSPWFPSFPFFFFKPSKCSKIFPAQPLFLHQKTSFPFPLSIFFLLLNAKFCPDIPVILDFVALLAEFCRCCTFSLPLFNPPPPLSKVGVSLPFLQSTLFHSSRKMIFETFFFSFGS